MATMGTPYQRRLDGRLMWCRVDTWRAGGALSADIVVCHGEQDRTRACHHADFSDQCAYCWRNMPHTLACHEATRKEEHV